MSCHYAYDELCVTAAFLGCPCIFGVPAQGPQTGRLQERVLAVVRRLESKGLLLVEPGGKVRVDEQLYRIVNCMARAERNGYLAVMKKGTSHKTYLYYLDQAIVMQESDQRGSARIDLVEDQDLFRTLVAQKLNAGEQQAVAALLLEKRGERFEVALDGAWQEAADWEKQCNAICDVMWKGRE